MNRLFSVIACLTALSSVSFAGFTTAPTPEPASIGLMAAGLGGLAYVAWRKKRQK